jgi:hypothetical protein
MNTAFEAEASHQWHDYHTRFKPGQTQGEFGKDD